LTNFDVETLRSGKLGDARVNALNNLTSIAQVLGAERTRGELLPYIAGK
jgi:hypothetical protein